MSQEEGGCASLFSLPMVLRGWGPGLGRNIHRFQVSRPGPPWTARFKSTTQTLTTWVNLWSRAWDKQGIRFHSAIHSGCILYDKWGAWFCSASVSGHPVRDRWGVMVLPSHSLGTQSETSGAHSSVQLLSLDMQWETSGHTVLLSHSLWAWAAEITLRASQPLLETFLQSSCPQFLTSAWLFTQPNFPTSPETIWVRVWHGPTPPFSKCHLEPQFLWYRCPQSQRMCTTCVCLLLRLYFPQRLQASRSLLVPDWPPCSGRGGSW